MSAAKNAPKHAAAPAPAPKKQAEQPAQPAQGMPANNQRRGPMGGRGMGRGGRMMPGEKAKDFKGTILKMARFMGNFK
ncbi:MAG: hypothetical protein FWD72_05325, partial [Eggerthellaceae bacterium]|nr:hypothetical protein [Eggerthellaceae bacterium]